MKNIIKSFTLFSAGLMLFSCNNADYTALGDSDNLMAYFTESTQNSGINNAPVTVSNEMVTVALTPCVSTPATEDVVLKLVTDPAILEKYNAENGLGNTILPSDFYELPKENIVIPKGKNTAGPVNIKLKPLSSEYAGSPLGLPLRIEAVSGPARTTTTTSSFVYDIKSTLNFPIAQFYGASGYHCNDFNKTLDNFTVEVRFQVSNTFNRNRDVFQNGSSGCLMRFEDPQSQQGSVARHSAIQFQGNGGYLNPDPLVGFSTNVWQHLAVTWNGKTINLYYNGKKVGTKDFSKSVVAEGAFPIVSWLGGGGGEGGGHGTGTQWWSGCKVMFTEARVWSVARTDDQIANNIQSVDTKSKGLEGYWRMGKPYYDENKKTFKDLTGNGHDLTPSSYSSITWSDNVSSEDTKTDWKF
ncbi:DUF1735 domain-containing protein [uncultured Bacteroides sp.]|jgi:hypothetical protein|uniref:BT_3987 domain-containing protein n=1 Tax=uncultured Bacteroides sp. TaxID=162156 RepID=UPI0025F9BEBF|nr:DUF1735 domain-containing protein [uncultured Bacteroides sp.]